MFRTIILIMLFLVLILLGCLVFYLHKGTHIFENKTSTEVFIEGGNVPRVEITVVVDNSPDPNRVLKNSWGLSILIDVYGNNSVKPLRILFDTGPSPSILEYNLEKLGIDPASIDIVVISHHHGDHIGGLSYILASKPGIKVYLPATETMDLQRYIRRLGGEPVPVNDSTIEIYPGVYVIGELYGPPFEDALAINVKDEGLLIITGCCHPGVVNIVKKAIHDIGVKPYIVMGGFHLIGASSSTCMNIVEELINLGTEKIGPMHCSGDTIKSILQKYYPDHYLELRTGSQLIIKSEK